ncbi:hypothetical protein Pelo_10119 [Pelomyxa schiedti]|nr:hypothetical protein Pelo_10119 [Pelomyxa schiedti]
MDEDLKRLFVKDTSLPIQVYEDPYFDYYIDLYEPVMQSRTKYNAFVAQLKLLGKPKFLSKRASVIDAAIKAINAEPEFVALQKDPEVIHRFQETNLFDTEQLCHTLKNLYQPANAGKQFISLDLRQANFNALRVVHPSIVKNATTYEEFMANFTSDQTIISSKNIRQVIFGKANPKYQQIIETFIIHKIAHDLNKHGIALKNMACSTDEILIPVTDSGLVLADVLSHINALLHGNPRKSYLASISSFVRVAAFDLLSVGGKPYYVKKTISASGGSLEFKGIPAYLYPQVFKKYLGLPLCPYDFLFIYEGFLAKLETHLYQE